MEYRIHLVEYLGTTLADTTEGEVAVITIRPDADSFRPHNIGLLKSQAERLLDDLQRTLGRVAPLFLLVLVASGCSGRLEVGTKTKRPTEASEVHTAVEIGVLADGNQFPAVASPIVERESPVEGDRKAADVSVTANLAMAHGNGEPTRGGKRIEVIGTHNFVVNVAGDLHIHEHTDVHIHEAPQLIESPRKTLRIEVSQPSVDPRCELLLREHEQRVGEWKKTVPECEVRSNESSSLGETQWFG